MHYSCEATAKRAPGQPLILTALGRFESAPVVENMEVAVAGGGRGGHRDDGVSSCTDRKRKAPDGGHSNDDVSSCTDRKTKGTGWADPMVWIMMRLFTPADRVKIWIVTINKLFE